MRDAVRAPGGLPPRARQHRARRTRARRLASVDVLLSSSSSRPRVEARRVPELLERFALGLAQLLRHDDAHLGIEVAATAGFARHALAAQSEPSPARGPARDLDLRAPA